MPCLKLSTVAYLTLAAGLAAVPWDSHALAAGDVQAGAEEYRRSCLSCHGPDGHGDGAVAPHLDAEVPDLTTLRARNDGTFPEDRVRAVIDGRGDIPQHGDRAMPIWGARYKEEITGRGTASDPSTDDTVAEHMVQARIQNLVAYLKSIQAPTSASRFPAYRSAR